MAVGIGDLIVVHSGGSANTDPLADLGGAISTAGGKQIVSQLATRSVTNITGITIIDSYGNPEGAGSLFYDDSETSLGWRPYGESTYYGVDVSINSTYVIGSSSGYLVVTTTGIPSGADLFDTVTVANNQQNVFPSVSAGDSLLGRVDYRCLYIQNSHVSDVATNCKLWILSNTPAGDTIDIGLDPIGKNGVATTSNGTTAPSGVTFSAPTSQGAGLSLGNLSAGEYYAFWQRRTVPPETRGTVISNSAALAISIDV